MRVLFGGMVLVVPFTKAGDPDLECRTYRQSRQLWRILGRAATWGRSGLVAQMGTGRSRRGFAFVGGQGLVQVMSASSAMVSKMEGYFPLRSWQSYIHVRVEGYL